MVVYIVFMGVDYHNTKGYLMENDVVYTSLSNERFAEIERTIHTVK